MTVDPLVSVSERLRLVDASRLGDEDGIAAVREAAATHSSFYLAEHGATAEVARLLALSRSLFALPVSTRERAAARGAQAAGYHGGEPSAPVFVANRAGPELAAVFGDNRWPEELPELAGAVSAYFDAMYAIAMKVLASVARGLDLPADHFEASFGDGAVHNLQLRFYDASGAAPTTPLDAHADPPPITLIAQDGVGGLDSLCQGRWIPVHPIGGTLVVQFGELMGAWTANRYPASVHRVVAGGTPRHSLVYNLLPRPDALVACVPSCRPRDESPPPVTVEEFLRTHLRRAVAYSPDALASAGRADAPSAGAALPEALLARCREAVRGASRATALKSASRSDDLIRVVLDIAGTDVVLEVSRVASDRRYYQRFGTLGFSYRGQITDAAVLRALDAVLPALAGVLADSF